MLEFPYLNAWDTLQWPSGAVDSLPSRGELPACVHAEPWEPVSSQGPGGTRPALRGPPPSAAPGCVGKGPTSEGRICWLVTMPGLRCKKKSRT